MVGRDSWKVSLVAAPPSPGGMNAMYPRDDFGVNEVLKAADAVLAERCIGACLEHVNTPCIRWGDVIRLHPVEVSP